MMQKNMLVLMGSPSKQGYTKFLLDLFLKEWQKQFPDTSISIFDAYKENIAPCTACGYCQHKLGCKFQDYEKFDSLYRNADMVVVASPVYGLSFPAPLKAVFDRTQQYYEAYFKQGIKLPIEKPKKAVLLCAYGSNDVRGAQIMEEQLKLIFSVMNTKLLGTISCGNTDSKPPETEVLQQMVTQLLLVSRDKL